VPDAYNAALREMTRRKKFRQLLDRDFSKLKQFVREEQTKRQEYKDNTAMYLPSSFCPGLKEPAPTLSLEGTLHDLEFPNFPEVTVVLDPPFKQLEASDSEMKLRISEFTQNLEDKENLIQKL
jgi:hypothetical protein